MRISHWLYHWYGQLCPGLIKAYEIVEDGRVDEFVRNRYHSFQEGIGREIVEGRTTLEQLEAYTLEHGEVALESGRQEYLEGVVNNILFRGVK